MGGSTTWGGRGPVTLWAVMTDDGGNDAVSEFMGRRGGQDPMAFGDRVVCVGGDVVDGRVRKRG